VAVLAVPPNFAVIVDTVFEFTADVFTKKLAEVFPDGMVTVAGAVAADPLTETEIDRPPDGDADPIVIVPVVGLPPLTVVGLSVSDFTVGGSIVSLAV